MPSSPGVPGGALPFSGPLDLASINAEWGLGTDLTNYHGVRWYYDGNLTTGLFSGSIIKVSDFRGKRATDPASGGTYFANVAGSGSFTIPLYRNSIKIEIWGGGGSGGNGNGGTGTDGGDSSVLGVTAGGGKAGGAGSIPVPAPVNIPASPSGGGRDPSGGGYYSGSGGYGPNGGGNNVQGSGPGGTIQDCLVPWAKIAMEDGTLKEVQNISIGDKVKSMSGVINKVIAISSPTIDTNLVEFNGLESFITETHPLLTNKGWGTFNLELFKLCQQHEYQKIVEDNNGNELIQIDERVELATKITDVVEFVTVSDIKFKEVKDFVVYRISVDGDNTYISENFISHNKPI